MALRVALLILKLDRTSEGMAMLTQQHTAAPHVSTFLLPNLIRPLSAWKLLALLGSLEPAYAPVFFQTRRLNKPRPLSRLQPVVAELMAQGEEVMLLANRDGANEDRPLLRSSVSRSVQSIVLSAPAGQDDELERFINVTTGIYELLRPRLAIVTGLAPNSSSAIEREGRFSDQMRRGSRHQPYVLRPALVIESPTDGGSGLRFLSSQV